MKVTVEFDSIEQANIAVAALNTQPAAPTHYAPPAQVAAPTPQYHAPAPLPQAAAPVYTPPAPPVHVAPAAPASGITAAQVASQAQVYAKAHGPKAAKAVFAEFGAGAVGQIAPENYPAVMQRLTV